MGRFDESGFAVIIAGSAGAGTAHGVACVDLPREFAPKNR